LRAQAAPVLVWDGELFDVLSAAAAYRLHSENLTRSTAAAARSPLVARETAYYLAHIGEVKSVADLTGDRRLLRYALKAFGLEDMAYAGAFIRRVLEGGVDAPRSLANSLADPRYREFAETFNFARYGAATTSFTRTQQGTVDRFVRQTVEENAGRESEGARLALYFERKAPSVRNTYGLLADRALLKVVQVALGLSEATSRMDIDRQARLIEERIDIADFREPAQLRRFLERFTSLWDVANAGTAAGPAALAPFAGASATIGVDLLGSLQKLKLGG
jgi:uncharacterized protein DUF1217